MIYREHKRFLDESLETAVEVQPTLRALYEHLVKILRPPFESLAPKSIDEVSLVEYTYDDRINENTHMVLVRERCRGWTDGPLLDYQI